MEKMASKRHQRRREEKDAIPNIALHSDEVGRNQAPATSEVMQLFELMEQRDRQRRAEEVQIRKEERQAEWEREQTHRQYEKEREEN